ncbi:putative NTPase (NACHT family) [Limihaloglobus sulfuriphilus]|uniref:Putative NTPase (NACHT family) n=1 Tax=Limihaloglobus sulfuriphilus TaxID=1851148 RepID=A0A1Q2MFG3_9BACT|nr:ATP-binding protein [Limihaloglobus sulfuriphilus]AQQ71436.1 putative NTPase (NACHT family) [Limihaloglobus sulfuriphilus]
MGKKKTIDGAKEAVTGYEFQFVWTARRCLSMLKHNSNIQQVCVESMAYKDEIDFGQGPETFLGVDTSEYHGGKTFSKASKIIISQLKCGISKSNKQWTISQTCQKKRSLRSSVIGRLSSTFEGYYKKKSPKVIAQKLRLQIVSNRGLNIKSQKLVSKAQNLLNRNMGKPNKWRFAKLKQSGFSINEKAELEKLYKASGLASNAFCVFLSCLDLSKLGIESPILQRIHLEEEIKTFDRAFHNSVLLKLCDLIREFVQKDGGTITIDNVLSCFNTNKDNFFPAPCLIESPSLLIETEDCQSLAKLIANPDTNKLLVHGEAGIGKSLTMKSLQKYLPQGSVSVVYDCYAGGKTETPNKYRFPDEVLCTQLVNELSLLVEQNVYLIRNRTDQIDAWNTLELAINKAAEKLSRQNALLVLIVDAADNAVDSYDRNKEITDFKSFIPKLWNISLPKNVKLVYTCRTFRKSKLKAPKGIKDFKLKGFTKNNSTEYLHNYFPHAAPEIGSDFHDKTCGVPRHQNYWLEELHKKCKSDAFAEIKTTKIFGLTDLYNDWLMSAETVLPSKVSSKKVISLLRVAASPISISVISNCLGIEEETVLAFCQGLGPGIVLNDQKELRFRDEDYETFLDEKLKGTDIKVAHDALSHHCLRTIESDVYSVKYACMHLFNAERHEELLRIVTGKSGINFIDNPIEQTVCEQDRMIYAFKSAAILNNSTAALQLLFEVGRINRTDYVLSETMTSFPELVIQHSSYQTLENSLQKNNSHSGNIYFRIAAELSKTTHNRNVAESNYAKGKAWLQLHITEMKKHDWRGFQYTIKDSAAEALAAMSLYGIKQAKQVLRCWVNSNDRLQSIYEFFKRLSIQNDRSYVLKTFNNFSSSTLDMVAAIAGMYEVGYKPSKTKIEQLTIKLQKWFLKNRNNHDEIGLWIISFLELAAKVGVSKTILLDIIKYVNLQNNNSIYRWLSVNEWYDHHHMFAKFLAFKSTLKNENLRIEELFPKDIEKFNSSSYSSSSEYQRSIRQIKLLLPVYTFISESFLKNRSINTITNQLKKLISNWTQNRYKHWDRHEPLYEVFVTNAINILVKTNGSEPTLVDQLLEPCKDIIGYNPCNLYLSVADLLSRRKEYHDIALELIGKVKTEWCKKDFRASDTVQRLMKCSVILSHIDMDISKQYFDDAFVAASGIDDDASYYLKSLANLSEYCSHQTPIEERSLVAKKLKVAIEQYWPIMEEEERIPWDEYVKAIATLDSNIGLNAVYEMDKKGWLDITQVSSKFASGLITGKQIDQIYSHAFHQFNTIDKNYLCNSLKVLKGISSENPIITTQLFERVANDIRRDSPIEERSYLCNQLAIWGKYNNMPPALIKELTNSYVFYEKRENWINTDHDNQIKTEKHIDLSEKWLIKAKARGSDKLVILKGIIEDNDLLGEQIISLVVEISQFIRGSKRIAFLNILTSQIPDSFSYYRTILPNILNNLITKWCETPGISEWAKENIPLYIDNNFNDILGYDYDISPHFRDLIENQVFSNDERTNVILPALANNAPQLSARSAYKTACLLGRYLSEDKLVSTLQILLKKTPSPADNLEENNISNLAKFIYKLLEQPDNRMRWRVFHVARNMLYLRPEPLLAELVNLTFSKEGKMWMSAREWLLFLLLHIAHINPKSLLHYAPRIYEHASDPDFPHAGMQELAKRTLMILQRFNGSLLTNKQFNYLSLLNEPRHVIWPKQNRYTRRGKHPNPDKKWRFSFDTMDTFPYWYSPLGHCFGLHRCDVAVRAESWICDKWKVTSNDCMKYSHKKVRGTDYNLFGHRHGSHPTIETLSTYIERHAMHMAAGEMIRELPITPEPSDEYGSWGYWISRNCFDADPLVTCDLHCPVPLHRFMHGVPDIDINPSEALTMDFFSDQLYGLIGKCNTEWLTISGYYTVRISNHSFTISIESALVTAKTARALGRAMLSSEYPQSIGIPEFKISYQHNVSEIETQLINTENKEFFEPIDYISQEGFELSPFTTEFHTERSMHTMDPTSKGLPRDWSLPSYDFIQKERLKREPDKLTYKTTKGDIVVKPESWEEGDYNEMYDNRTTHGHRLNIKKEHILSYLEKINKDLLIRIIIRKHNDTIKDPKEYDHGQAKIFILRQNGKIEKMG